MPPYVQLVATANRLLKNKGMTDACHYLETPLLLESLGISEINAEIAMEKPENAKVNSINLLRN